jgi:hypothetical protein
MDYSESRHTIEIQVVGFGFCTYKDEADRDKHVVYDEKFDMWRMKGDTILCDACHKLPSRPPCADCEENRCKKCPCSCD